MVDALLLLALLVLGSIAVASTVLAFRHRLSFRIAHRNLRRARARSVLMVLGLLVATAMVSGSLAVGETVRTVNLHYTYLALGYTDEGIYGLDPGGGYLYFPQSVATAIAEASLGVPSIAGVTPEIVDRVQVFDRTTGIPQTNLNLLGADPANSTALGSFTTLAGAPLAGPGSGKVLLDARAADDLNASVGDTVTVYGAVALNATVQAVVQDDLRGGFLTAGLSGGNVFVDLATAQSLVNGSGLVNFLAVSNAGSQKDGVGLTSQVCAQLNATLASTPGSSRLEVHNLLQASLSSAEAASSWTETSFLVFGLFSIVAGAMLIVGIFTMLAEERKGETGMLRAIGLPRRAIVLSYFFEGLFYSAGSALAGTLVGLAAGYGLMALYTTLVPNSGVSASVLLGSFTFTQDTLLMSYLVGFLLTLATVTVASFRVSRLNIVRSLRDVPEAPPALRTYTRLAYLGAVTLVLGALLFGATYRGTSDVIFPILGGALLLVGGGLVAARFVPARVAFSAVGVGLLVWVGAEQLRAAVLGPAHSFSTFVVFVMGILMVAGGLLLVAFNGPLLARAVERLASGRAGSTPVTRLGLAYPSRRAARASTTLTIFALVLFTIVVLSTFAATLTGSLRDSISAQSGGYSFYGTSEQPIPDLPGSVGANATLAPLFATVVPLVTGTGYVTVDGYPANPFLDRVFAAPTGGSPATSFYATNRFPFQSTIEGWSADRAMTELATNGSVVVVDARYAGAAAFGPTSPHPVVAIGDILAVSNPATGDEANLTVIGILRTQILGGIWLNPTAASALGFHTVSGYLLTLSDGVSPTVAAQKIKAAFFPYGLVLVEFSEVLATMITLTSGDISLLEVFIGLGLTVGIAALGILALRAVAERRREIGTLRATGLTRGAVLRVFLVEYTFLTMLGALIGGVLGVLIIYNLVTGAGAASAGVSALYIPWSDLLLIMLGTGLLATLAVVGPSLKAARLPPAEAIRGAE